MPSIPQNTGASPRSRRPNDPDPEPSLQDAEAAAAAMGEPATPQGWPPRPLSLFVWGSHREANDLVAYALARELDPSLFWLEVGEAPRRSATSEPARLGWVPADHVYLAHDPEALAPRELPTRGLHEYVRGDESASRLDALSGFLRLPNVVQEIVSRAPPAPRPCAVVFANAERAPALLRRSDGPSLVILEALREASVSVVVSYTGRAPVDRLGFDVVLRMDVPGLSSWHEAQFTCERTFAHGPFHVGETARLSSVPAFVSTFGRLASRK